MVAQPMLTDMPTCIFPNVDVEITCITIRTVSKHPQLYTPFCWLVPYVLPNPWPVPRFHHSFINRNILAWLIQALALTFDVLNERLDFAQFIIRLIYIFCFFSRINNMQHYCHECSKPFSRYNFASPKTVSDTRFWCSNTYCNYLPSPDQNTIPWQWHCKSHPVLYPSNSHPFARKTHACLPSAIRPYA